jgi:GMP synthase (glutamine-hydrolysing)
MTVYIVNLGSQYTHVIWRTVRDLGYSVEIKAKESKLEDLKDADAIIFSGGPGSAYKDDFGVCKEIVEKIRKGEWSMPLLGICMGHQLIAYLFGGIVQNGKSAEYGIGRIIVDKEDLLFNGVPKEFNAWISHFDEVEKAPKEFEILAHSNECKVEAMRHRSLKIFSVQFHPEVWHTENGETILGNFLGLIKK